MSETYTVVYARDGDEWVAEIAGTGLTTRGSNVGELTSAGYSRLHGRAVAMGYARSDRVLSDEELLAAHYQIDIAGELFAATPHLKLS